MSHQHHLQHGRVTKHEAGALITSVGIHTLKCHDRLPCQSVCTHPEHIVLAGVQIGMIFVRCREGISHSSLEHVDDPDIAAATAALYFYLSNHLALEQ